MLGTQTGAGTQRWAWWGTPPGGDPPASWQQVGDAGPLPSWKEQPFVLNGIDTSEHGLAFLTHVLLPKLIPM